MRYDLRSLPQPCESQIGALKQHTSSSLSSSSSFMIIPPQHHQLMDEESLKQNTDCVYFLASPLSCKKGIECEYRHNDIARLNPRDCWYWLYANCLNPSCSFRHPPFEKHAEAPLEPASLPYQSSISPNMTSVPCYFYYNGYCNKGDRCSFLHGPVDNKPDEKYSKTSSTITIMPPLVTKTSVEKETVSKPMEAHYIPSETVPKAEADFKLHPRDDVQLSSPTKLILQNPTVNIAVLKCKEIAPKDSDSLPPSKGFLCSRADICADQSSEEVVVDQAQLEERWESSPGFDVLVDNASDNLIYEDEQENLLVFERENMEFNNHCLGYDFDDYIEFDPIYPGDELLHEGEMYDSFDPVDNAHVFDDVDINSGHSRGKMLDSLLSMKRKLLPVELEINDLVDVDLRDHLSKLRVIDGCQLSQPSRRHDLSHLLGRNQERLRRHGISKPLHERWAPRRNAIEPFGNNRTQPIVAKQRGWHWKKQSNRARQRHKGKRMAERRFVSSEVARKPVSVDRISAQASAGFTGPKTLAQINKEKKNVGENADLIGKRVYPGLIASEDFEGPKPLSEILKDKRRLGLVKDCNGDSK